MAALTKTPSGFRSAFFFALLLFALKAAFVLATPVRALGMTPWLIDDSFIVMRVARNLALGAGFSFDGLHPTTGVSPLWTYLTSLHHLLFTKEMAVKATLITSSLFGALATVVVYVLALELSGRRSVAWVALLLSSFLPALFFNALNGMETGLFTLLILLAVGSSLGTGATKRLPPLRWGLMTGIMGGLTLLLRADGIFLILSIVLVKLILLKKRKTRGAQQELLGITIGSGVCLLILLFWQFLMTGALVPANQVGRRGLALAWHGFSYQEFDLLRYLTVVAWNVFQFEKLLSIISLSSILVLFVLMQGILQKRTAVFSSITSAYLFLFGSALIFYQWYFPDFHGLRYLNSLGHLLTIPLALLLLSIPEHRWKVGLVSALVVVALALSWYTYRDLGRKGSWAKRMDLFAQVRREDQDAFWSSIDWIRDNIPKDAVIGVRDHGRIAYFTDRPIQDLAGIIDPAVVKYWKEGTLGTYLKGRSVSYVFLPEPQRGSSSLYQAVHDSLHLRRVADAPPQHTTGYHLYRVES